MGLIITATEKTTLKVKGFNGVIESAYLRLRAYLQQDGRTMEIQCDSYHAKENYSKGENLPIQFQMKDKEGNIGHHELPVITCQVAVDELQSVETAHKYTKLAFEELGYTVEEQL